MNGEETYCFRKNGRKRQHKKEERKREKVMKKQTAKIAKKKLKSNGSIEGYLQKSSLRANSMTNETNKLLVLVSVSALIFRNDRNFYTSRLIMREALISTNEGKFILAALKENQVRWATCKFLFLFFSWERMQSHIKVINENPNN